jgi:hypothetical protein
VVWKCSARLSFVVYSGIRSSRGTVLALGLGARYKGCHVPCGEARHLFTLRTL